MVNLPLSEVWEKTIQFWSENKGDISKRDYNYDDSSRILYIHHGISHISWGEHYKMIFTRVLNKPAKTKIIVKSTGMLSPSASSPKESLTGVGVPRRIWARLAIASASGHASAAFCGSMPASHPSRAQTRLATPDSILRRFLPVGGMAPLHDPHPTLEIQMSM